MKHYLTGPWLLLSWIVLINPYGPSKAFTPSRPVTTDITPASPLLLLSAKKDDGKDTQSTIGKRKTDAKKSARPEKGSTSKKTNTDQDKKAQSTKRKPESKSKEPQYRWLKDQHNSSLDPKRKALLKSKGLKNVGTSHSACWDQMLDKLEQFKSRHGTFRPRQAEDLQLYRWVYKQNSYSMVEN
jgi:hypothetical protein